MSDLPISTWQNSSPCNADLVSLPSAYPTGCSTSSTCTHFSKLLTSGGLCLSSYLNHIRPQLLALGDNEDSDSSNDSDSEAEAEEKASGQLQDGAKVAQKDRLFPANFTKFFLSTVAPGAQLGCMQLRSLLSRVLEKLPGRDTTWGPHAQV